MDFQQIRDFVNPAVAQATGLQEVENLSMPVPVAYVPVQLVIDGALSLTSENPVQNKVIAVAIQNLDGRITAIEGQFSEGVTEAVNNWLAAHPEATTTVQDGAITYAKLDANLKGEVDQISELKSVIQDKAPAIIADSSLKHTFSAEEMQEVVDFSVIIQPSVSTSMDVMLGQDLIPELDAYSGGCFNKGGGNKIVVDGSPSANSTYYGRVGTKSKFTPNVFISSGETVYLRYYLSGSVTALSGGTEPGRVGLTLHYKNGTSKTQYYGITTTRTGLFGNSVTASDDVESIGFEFLAKTGYTYSNYTLYFVASKVSNTRYSDLAADLVLTKTQTGTNGIAFIPNNGYMHYVADTKTYIDNNIPDDVVTEAKLIYLTPEMYNAKGDGVTDDSLAIQNCIDDALTKKVAVRGFGKYAIASTIAISGNYQDIYLNRLTYSGSGSAVTLAGKSNKITVVAIDAYSNGICFRLVCDDSDTEFNEVNIWYAQSYGNTIECVNLNESYSMYYNRFNLGRLYSRTANCIYNNAYRFAENFFFGNSLSCQQGYAVYDQIAEATRNLYSGFGIEAACKNGFYAIANIQNCRTIECMDQKRPDNDSGTIIRIPSGMLPTRCKWDNLTYVDYDSIDVSLCRTFSDCLNILKDSYENGATRSGAYDNAFTYYKNNVLGEAYRLGTHHNMPNQEGGLFPMPGHIIAYFNHKGFVPENGWYKQITVSEYTPYVTSAEFPTEFDLTINSSIHFEDSYCAVGIKDVTIHQYENAKATVYDRDGNVIFDGQNNSAGTYKLHCSWIPYTFTVETTRGNLTYTHGDYYYGSMCDRWTVEKLNIV